jgi:hypothetical protein
MERGFSTSMKRTYELTAVLRVDPNEQVMKDNIEQVKNWVEADGLGTVNKVDTTHWGRRRLAYEITASEGFRCVNGCRVTGHLPNWSTTGCASHVIFSFAGRIAFHQIRRVLRSNVARVDKS